MSNDSVTDCDTLISSIITLQVYVHALISLHQVGKLKTASVSITTRSGWTDDHSTSIHNVVSIWSNPINKY